jgi:hypothetical protein
MKRNGRTAAIALLAFASACEQPEHASAAVEVMSPAVNATITQLSEKRMTFNIPVEVRNTGLAGVGIVSCNWVVEEMTNNQWKRVWTPPCPTVPTNPEYLEGGETRSMTLSVSAKLNGNTQDWSGSEGGSSFRVKLWVVKEGSNLSRYPELKSNNFAINAQ